MEGTVQKKSFNTPDDVMTPSSKTKVEIVKVNSKALMRATFDAGWKWSTDIGPTAGTTTCQAHHVMYLISGQMKVVMEDGTAMEFGPGDIADIPAGHDAWVLGEEPVVSIDVADAIYS
jgi:uncharacterized cupin superfamily protein